MEKMHMQDARKEGFIIDDCCNPPIAYKGPRFQPTTYRQCYTPLETKLLAMLGQHEELIAKVGHDTACPYATEAFDLLVPLRSQLAEAKA